MSHNEDLRMLRCTGKNNEKRNVSTIFGWGGLKTVVCPLLFFLLFCPYCYGWGEKSIEAIDLVDGKEHEFSFSMNTECTYEIGVYLKFENNDLAYIKSVLGKYPNISLPAIIDIQIINNKSEIVFDKQGFGGKVAYTYYGPNPTYFVAGDKFLSAQPHKVKVSIKNTSNQFSQVKAYFFIKLPPKTICN